MGDQARRARLAHHVLWRFSPAMFGANLLGALDVFVLLTWVLPTPGDYGVADDVWLFAGYMVFGFFAGGWASARLAAPVAEWLRSGRPASDRDRDAVLRLPSRQTAMHAAMWGVGAVVFTAANADEGGDLACYVGVTIVMGGLTTCALTYLLAERMLRPVTALALASGTPQRPVTPGVAGRLLVSWVMATGVPLVGLILVGLDLLGDRELSPERVAATMLALSGLALLSGLIATVTVAQSISEPLRALRRALARVERGELEDVDVRVYDGSEVGLVQSGFNQMAAGLRERERLRDLFGRHVGEDVARAALHGGDTGLGGQVRDVAVLFVDLVGSTALAARRPPTEVVSLLNRFFAIVVETVADHDGWINKFEGDAALAVFGAPVDHPDPAGAALCAARQLHERLARELPQVDAGLGVSAGPAVAGNVGAESRFEYTVIGDPVNEAARLCERAKRTPGRVLASEAVLSRARNGEAGRWRLGETVELRGRTEPTRTAQPAAAA
jgi:adenylate cyclase